MAINKVEYGDRTLIDLTQDTVTPETLLEGETAHDKTGELIRGTHVPFSGQYEDLQGKPETFPPSSHNQPASTIQAGTFAGQIASPSNGQNPGAYCLRNSKLSRNGEKPTVNGQIVVGYDGKPSSVMVGGTVYPIGGKSKVDTLIHLTSMGSTTGSYNTIIVPPITDYDVVFISWQAYGYYETTFLVPSAILDINIDMGLSVRLIAGEGRYDISMRFHGYDFQQLEIFANPSDSVLDIIGIKY